jgi:hypothetical protein
MNIIFSILLLILSFMSIAYITYIRYKNRFMYTKINDKDDLIGFVKLSDDENKVFFGKLNEF